MLTGPNAFSEDRDLVILGNGGHSSSVAEAAESAGFRVVKLLAIIREDSNFEALIDQISNLGLEQTSFALAVGTNFVRESVHLAVTTKFLEAKFPPVVHTTAWVSPTASVAEGVVALAHASVGANTRLGVGSLLNAGASLDHDGSMGDFGSLGPGARTGGNVTIGQRSMIGLQAGIIQGRTVHEDSVVGAQSLVLEDIPPLSVAIGSPCTVVRSREWNESYY